MSLAGVDRCIDDMREREIFNYSSLVDAVQAHYNPKTH